MLALLYQLNNQQRNNMLTDLLGTFIKDMTHALTINDYAQLVPERMLKAVESTLKLEAEIQRLQDKFTAMEAREKSLEYYMQNSRRYLQLRNMAQDDLNVVVNSAGCNLRGAALDTKIDAIANKKATDFSKFVVTLGKPVTSLPMQPSGKYTRGEKNEI